MKTLKNLAVVAFLVLIAATSCKKKTSGQKSATPQVAQQHPKKDTLIIARPARTAKPIIIVYSPVVLSDTLTLSLTYIEDDGDTTRTKQSAKKAYAKINFQRDLPYKKAYELLAPILRKANGNTSLSSLQYIDIENFAASGDIAIAVSNDLLQKAKGARMALFNHRYAAELLLDTRLTVDLNKQLKPYALQVANYEVKEIGFIKKDIFTNKRKLDTPPEEIPDQLWDASLHIKLRKINDNKTQ